MFSATVSHAARDPEFVLIYASESRMTNRLALLLALCEQGSERRTFLQAVGSACPAEFAKPLAHGGAR